MPLFLKNPASWDVGMEFGDVGCVRISSAINPNPFSAILIESQLNPIGIVSTSGYLDIRIIGYLDSGQNHGFMYPQSGLLCGAALPGAFFPEKTRPRCFCSLKQCFLHSAKTIFNGTRLDGRGLKS